jgi:cytochrome P450
MRFMRALSAKAVASQEPTLKEYATKLVRDTNEELPDSANGRVVDLAKWFSMATFDLIGDLAFSQSFGCLETDVLHPWIKVVFGAFKALPLLRVIREISGVPFLGGYAKHLLPTKIKQMWIDHFNYRSDLIDERLASGKDRPDMVHYLTTKKGLPLTINEIKENAVQMVTAGSEPVGYP